MVKQKTSQTGRPSSWCKGVESTCLTETGSLKVTKPKPRDLPVSLFFMTRQETTSPNSEKYPLSLSVNALQKNTLTLSTTFLEARKEVNQTFIGLPAETTDKYFTVTRGKNNRNELVAFSTRN